MTTGAEQTRLRVAADRDMSAREGQVASIVAGVDGSSASTVAVDAAVDVAGELGAPIVFVYVRRGPAGLLGEPAYQRRLTAAMARGRRVLDDALQAAAAAGVHAEGEILEGSPRRRIAEFARNRGAQLVVVGSRRHRVGRSVSRGVTRASSHPVLVARRPGGPAVAGSVV
jgi:nucleotide-binding universal stress UspA family protein